MSDDDASGDKPKEIQHQDKSDDAHDESNVAPKVTTESVDTKPSGVGIVEEPIGTHNAPVAETANTDD